MEALYARYARKNPRNSNAAPESMTPTLMTSDSPPRYMKNPRNIKTTPAWSDIMDSYGRVISPVGTSDRAGVLGALFFAGHLATSKAN
jgi:hypothetical protein